MIDDDWVNIESSNLFEKFKPLQALNFPKPPEIQEMTIKKTPTITHRNVNVPTLPVNPVIVYHDDMKLEPKNDQFSKNDSNISNCVLIKQYVREAQMFLMKWTYCVKY